ncbi:XrtA/PEP-CTERM system histidine kinase PrsK [Rugamonas apoptosis]|uniref:histidine kinase n=1 Tax=Rugamonas apoptosis TaxID=2758570 RepID=A0A7W2F8V8_9BURK|nr:XrtA/PEP-CTERM system histidine kinase PrsK [Rugamonas apoptosis]MBA5687298.1 PEP-CTERM system histidine kinase PrsK [Rugamonas apoptosis]
MLAQWTAHDIAAFSYGSAGVAFTLLCLLLLKNWRSRPHSAGLACACLMTAAWASSIALGERLPMAAAELWLELARTCAWLVLLQRLHTQQRRPSAGLLAVLAALVAPSVAGGAGYAWLGPAVDGATLTIATRLMLAVLGMLLVEHLYRNTPAFGRWGIKFACLGIGGLFAYDFYLYSDALLFRQVNHDIWAARGIVNALCAPLIGIAAARNPAWAPGLSLSRQILFRSAALLGSATYLLAMASSAYYLRYVGGAWGPLMQLACLFGAALLLAGVLFSGAMRASLKVLINKHFYQGSYDYRQEWLRFTRALADDGPALGERTIQAVAALVESPAGTLWIRRERQRFEPAAGWNLALPQAAEPADSAFCLFLEQRQWVIDVAQWRQQAHPYEQLQTPSWLAALGQAWLVVPLMLHGHLFGFVTLDQPRVRMALNWEVTDLLKIAGSQAAGCLAHRDSADSLAVARQFESFNRMSAFIVHDLKNLVSQLSLLLSNAERHQNNPAFQQDMLATLAHSVDKMTLLLRKLHRSPDKEQVREQDSPLALDHLLTRAVQAYAARDPAPQLVSCAPGLMVRADGGRLERVLGHLLQNALEATPPGGSITVRLLHVGQAAVVELCDTGHGMSAQFIREHLFQPFDSTKPAGMGIGVFESREYIRDLGGELEVASTPGKGSTFRLVLPLYQQAAAAA